MRLKTLLLRLCLVALLTGSSAWATDSKVLFVRKEGKGFDEVYSAMRRELSDRYEITDFVISKSTQYEKAKEKIAEEAPALLVLMDNQSVRFASKYNAEQSDPRKKIKGVALMGLNLKSVLKGSRDFAGIAFETPAYTLLTQFRYVVDRPLRNVLTFYRKSLFGDAIKLASEQLVAEGIKLHAIDVEQDGTARPKVEAFLAKSLPLHLKSTGKYDAVWVLLDSGILNQKMFQQVWVPAASSSKLPFVTGAKELVSGGFATFAVTPNFSDLASQAAQQVDAILADRVQPGEIGVEDLISVDKFINTTRVKEIGLKLKESNLGEVNRIE